MVTLNNYTKFAPLFCEITLVLLIAWSVAGILFPQQPDTSADRGALIGAGESRLPPLDTLIGTPLFGNVEESPKPLQPKKPVVTLSPLNITLLGTIIAGRDSAAVIANQGSVRQEVFFIGDSIQPGAILREVYPNAIEIERNGKLERVSMETDTLAALPMSSTIPTAPVGVQSAPPTPGATLNRHMQREYIRQQTSNFTTLITQARAQPYMINGRPQGFILTDIVNGSLYQKAGLQNGDVIQRVNGKEVRTVQQAMAMYRTIQSASSIDIDILRGGQPQRIHYDIR